LCGVTSFTTYCSARSDTLRAAAGSAGFASESTGRFRQRSDGMASTTTTTIKDLLDACRESDAGAFKVIARGGDDRPKWVVIVATDSECAEEILAAVEKVEASWDE